MSRRITAYPSLGLPIFQWSDRSHDISDNLYFAGHLAEDFVGLPFGWDQPDDGFAVLGDQRRLTAVQYLVHHGHAVRSELTGKDLLHNIGHMILTMGGKCKETLE